MVAESSLAIVFVTFALARLTARPPASRFETSTSKVSSSSTVSSPNTSTTKLSTSPDVPANVTVPDAPM